MNFGRRPSETTSSPSAATPAPFVLYGTLGAPAPGASIPTTLGSFAFEPRHQQPAEPWLLLAADALFQDPAALLPVAPAPRTSPAHAIPFPATLTLQVVVQDSANLLDPFDITNGVILPVH